MNILLAFALVAPIAYAFDVPPNDGFVTDIAQVLTGEQEQALEQTLTQVRAETGNEIAVLIIPALAGEEIAQVAIDVGRAWGVGTAEDNNGVLLLISYGDREIFIATGYGLEGEVPDIVAKGIIEEDILPLFRDGEYAEGIVAGIDSLKKHIGGEYTAERYADNAGAGWGGGAIFLLFVLLDFFGAYLARTKSWWLGGVLGAALGMILTALFTWWLAIPVLTGLGFLFDYAVSKAGPRRGRRGGFPVGGFGRGGGGGFGGFSGGSFGGGGARGRW